MPRNGAGVYSLVNNTWYPPVNGVLATSSDWQTFINDVASALTQSVSSDGQTPMTGNLPMGNNKITGLANGTAATDAAAFGQIAQVVGQCQLTKSGSNLILLPYNGNKLFINGVLCTVPSAGVTLAPTGLTPSTNYNIYAVATGTTVSSIEASTTARATDTTYGNQIKSGDASRALVGKARIGVGPAWFDTDIARFVISWFNRRPIRIYTTNAGSPTSTTSAVTNLAAIMEFLTWGDSAIPASFIAQVSNSAANAITSTGLGVNATNAYSHTASNYQAYTASANGCASGGSTFVPVEGYAFISLNGSVSAGTGTWTAGLEASAVIQG